MLFSWRDFYQLKKSCFCRNPGQEQPKNLWLLILFLIWECLKKKKPSLFTPAPLFLQAWTLVVGWTLPPQTGRWCGLRRTWGFVWTKTNFHTEEVWWQTNQTADSRAARRRKQPKLESQVLHLTEPSFSWTHPCSVQTFVWAESGYLGNRSTVTCVLCVLNTRTWAAKRTKCKQVEPIWIQNRKKKNLWDTLV